MIPQRNLSLLANRLYKEHGGRRIPEAVLERDYCLAWFLVGLSQSKLRNLLIFKGGTALKRCHFGDYRFSEDLDFTLANRVEFAETRAALEEVYELVAQASGIRFSFEAEDRQTHVNSYTFYLRYQGPLPTSNTVKVDVTISEILLFPIEQLPVLRSYPEFEDVAENRPISVYSLNEIATEKIVALQDRARNEPRDLYDLWFLTSHAGVEIGNLIGAITEKLRFREKDMAGVEDRIVAKEARLKALWDIQDRRRTALRDAQPEIRTRIDSDHFEPAVSRVDRDPRLGTADRSLARRITHHVHILEMNGDSYRLKQSRRKRNPPSERRSPRRLSGAKSLFRYAPDALRP